MDKNTKPINKHSDTWCPLPFNAISFHPTGALTRCMMSDTPMGESYDSEQMKKLRQDMLDGKWDVKGCETCYKKEQHGNISQRQKWLLKDPQIFNSQEGYNNPQITGNPVNHMFINYSNICNFKCRMCNPLYSNSLIPEHKHLRSLDIVDGYHLDPNSTKNINSTNSYLKNNPSKLDSVTSIWITGGEPFMDDSVYDLVNILDENNKSFETDMVVTTNGSKVDLNKLQQFETLEAFELDVSVDAPNHMFEYMRSAGIFNWEDMQKLLDELKYFQKLNSSWFRMSFNSSIQAYNFDTILEFDKLCIEHSASNNSRQLLNPREFRTDVIPLEIRQKELFSLENYEVADITSSRRLRRTIEDACLNLAKPQADIEIVKRFVRRTIETDKYRNMYLYDYHKELGDWVYSTYDKYFS
jgi:MoaA/NifB/PqqE/SkfB family radical SAM enzyme